jgi:hypothetical protein
MTFRTNNTGRDERINPSTGPPFGLHDEGAVGAAADTVLQQELRHRKMVPYVADESSYELLNKSFCVDDNEDEHSPFLQSPVRDTSKKNAWHHKRVSTINDVVQNER